MELKFVVFLAASIVALWVLWKGDELLNDQDEASSHPGSVTASVDSILEGLYQLEG